MTARCASCGSAITWGLTATGRRMPVDADPSARGNIAIDHVEGREPTFRMITGAAGGATLNYAPRLYTSHFATCPHAAQHRKARA